MDEQSEAAMQRIRQHMESPAAYRRQTKTAWTPDRVKISPPPTIRLSQNRRASDPPMPNADLTAIGSRIKALLPMPKSEGLTGSEHGRISGNITSNTESNGLALRDGSQLGRVGADARLSSTQSRITETAATAGSRGLALLAKGIERMTHGTKLYLLAGPREWVSLERRFQWREMDSQTTKAAEFCSLAIAEALADRDDVRLTRSLDVLMMMPTSGDRLNADKATTWIMLLDDLPIWAVEEACVEHAKQEHWRPVPSQIRERAADIIAPYQRILRNCQHAIKTEKDA